MKKSFILTVVMMAVCSRLSYSQTETEKTSSGVVVYTFFCNVVPDGFRAPLVGFINVGRGDHRSLELGFVNTNFGTFTGLKMGFVNTTTKDASGVQMSFINTVTGRFDGLQMGFVNTATSDASGVRMGFVNTTAGMFKGMKMGFVNTTTKDASGAQIGFLNVAARKMHGFQLGLLNVADTIEHGTAVGLLTIVKKGGYRALELSVNEMYPVNIAFKIGLPTLYSFVQLSFYPGSDYPFATGAGLGSHIPLGTRLFLNPELGAVNPIKANNKTSTTTLAVMLKYRITPQLQVTFGPSLTWMNHPKDDNSLKPFISLYSNKVDTKNDLFVGLRAAFSYSFTEL